MKNKLNLLFAVLLGLFLVNSAVAADAITAGATSQIAVIKINDTSSPTTGAGKTGIAYNTAGFSCAYKRDGAASVALTLATMTLNTWASSGASNAGFVEESSSLHPGHYQISLPNAAVATGARFVEITCQGSTNAAQGDLMIPLSPAANITGVNSNAIEETDFAPTGLFVAGSSVTVARLSASETTNDISGQQLCITSGAGSKVCRPITAYDTTLKYATVSPAFPTAPAAGDGYSIGGYVASSGSGSCPTASAIVSALMLTNRATYQSNVGTYGEAWPAIAGNVGGIVASTAVCNSIGAAGINGASFAADTPFFQATAASVSTPGQATLVSGAPFGNQAVNNNFVFYVSATTGNGVGQMACIKNYNSTTRVATFTKAMQIPLTGTVKYMILPSANCNMSLWPTSH